MKTIRRDQVDGKKQSFYKIKSLLQNGNGNGKVFILKPYLLVSFLYYWSEINKVV